MLSSETAQIDDAKALSQALQRWFLQPPGTLLGEAERVVLKKALPNLFGYHILQLGEPISTDLLSSSRIAHRIVTSSDPASGDANRGPALQCEPGALPIAADSIDVVVLPHTLEFDSDPHQILREVERVLIGEGHVVIMAMNPWSLWGLWRLLLAWKSEPPWCGKFLSATRLKDWLKLLGFDIVSTFFVFYRPPFRHAGLLTRLAFLEKLGAYCWRYLGGAYILVGKKRLLTLTPVKTQWRARRSMIAAGMAEPSTRNDCAL